MQNVSVVPFYKIYEVTVIRVENKTVYYEETVVSTPNILAKKVRERPTAILQN